MIKSISAMAQLLLGVVGNDELNGGTRDDRLKGGSGDDTINGGEGKDVGIYTGARADYQIELIDGVYHLTDLRARSHDGHDTLVNVEVLRFSDGQVQIEDAVPGSGPLSDFWI